MPHSPAPASAGVAPPGGRSPAQHVAAFDFGVAPFDTLSPAQRALLCATAEVVDFEPDDPVLTPEMTPTHAYLLIDGRIRRERSAMPEATYAAGDLFGVRALLVARAAARSHALGAVRAWALPEATLRSLLAANPAFCAAVFAEVVRRLTPPAGAAPAGTDNREAAPGDASRSLPRSTADPCRTNAPNRPT